MLKQLYIKNFTLIDELNITLKPGFSVITGETGAGKSIIIGAIGLLLGNRTDTKTIKDGQGKCVIEAHVDLSDGIDKSFANRFFDENDIEYDPEDCIIRREVTSRGKSRAFINDTPVPLSAMKELGEQLIDIHSQHQNLLLNKEDFQLNVVDTIARDDAQLADYRASFMEYSEATRRLNKLRQDILESNENEDLIRFQHNELSEAKLVSGEQEQLERESDLLEHAEDIKTTLYNASNILTGEDSGTIDHIKTVMSQMQSIEATYPEISDITSRLDSAYIELKDIAQELDAKLDGVNFDPKRQNDLNERLDAIYSLEHKFHVSTINELLDIQNDLSGQLAHIDNSDEELEQQVSLVNALKEKCADKARSLTTSRASSAKHIETEMSKLLITLGIPDVRFAVRLSDKPLSEDGADKVSFLFSANKSTALSPISQVASGGEISRVMLSLKAMISNNANLPTIIFDEIDTGVSGRIAEKMARIMREMGNHRQVISITHLPQIAALGTTHYKVSKEEAPSGTSSTMYLLDNEQRVREIAQMLSGSNITEAAINNAKSLLNL